MSLWCISFVFSFLFLQSASGLKKITDSFCCPISVPADWTFWRLGDYVDSLTASKKRLQNISRIETCLQLITYLWDWTFGFTHDFDAVYEPKTWHYLPRGLFTGKFPPFSLLVLFLLMGQSFMLYRQKMYFVYLRIFLCQLIYAHRFVPNNYSKVSFIIVNS